MGVRVTCHVTAPVLSMRVIATATLPTASVCLSLTAEPPAASTAKPSTGPACAPISSGRCHCKVPAALNP